MPNSFVNFCYGVAGNREINKERDNGQYVLLSADTFEPSASLASIFNEAGSESSPPTSPKRTDLINKLFKAKAKTSDDEETLDSANDQHKTAGHESSDESIIDVSKLEVRGVINRKKKRTLAYFDNQSEQQKNSLGLRQVKIEPDSDKPKMDNVTSSTEPDSKTSEACLIEDKEWILEQFDPLWVGKNKNEKKGSLITVQEKKNPVKPSSNKINNAKVMTSENLPVTKAPELKIAMMNIIQENEISVEEVIEERSNRSKDGKLFVANIKYEGAGDVFARPVIYDNFDAVKEGVFPIAAATNAFKCDFGKKWAGASSSQGPPISAQPRLNPQNVWPGLYDNNLSVPMRQPIPNLNNGSKQGVKKLLGSSSHPADPVDQLRKLLYEEMFEEEDKTQNKIANFFAEERKVVNEQDIAKYTNKIEICDIEISEEDIKKYRQTLKYQHGPIKHDAILESVETALHFVENRRAVREQKMKVRFVSELFGSCWKGKKEKQDEANKRKEEENNKKDPKPKMWLVLNSQTKEKVIICAPSDFYDSD